MAISQFFAQPQDAPATNFWGSYRVEPTPNGIRFQVSVRDPHNNLLLAALIAFTFALAIVTYAGFWTFIGMLLLLLMLGGDPLFQFRAHAPLLDRDPPRRAHHHAQHHPAQDAAVFSPRRS
jgi:hypothetical protein